MQNHLNVFHDIFSCTLYQGIVCTHTKKTLKALGLTCKTFLDLYKKKFNPDLVGIKAWKVLKNWKIANKRCFCGTCYDYDFLIFHGNQLKLVCRALHKVYSNKVLLKKCDVNCYTNYDVAYFVGHYNNGKLKFSDLLQSTLANYYGNVVNSTIIIPYTPPNRYWYEYESNIHISTNILRENQLLAKIIRNNLNIHTPLNGIDSKSIVIKNNVKYINIKHNTKLFKKHMLKLPKANGNVFYQRK
jgi:hypothetical protein